MSEELGPVVAVESSSFCRVDVSSDSDNASAAEGATDALFDAVGNAEGVDNGLDDVWGWL